MSSICCDICNKWVHRRCTPLTVIELRSLGEGNEVWYCKNCIQDIFPFGNIDDVELLIEDSVPIDQIHSISDTVLNIKHTKESLFNHICNFDSERFALVDIESTSDYYTVDNFSTSFGIVASSISTSCLHVNARSLVKNLPSLINLIDRCSMRFSFITVVETWIQNDDSHLCIIPGYQLFHCSRKESRGGGVAIYVADSEDFSLVGNCTFSIEGICDIITIKCNVPQLNKNVPTFISCVYRKPTSDYEAFMNRLSTVINNVENNPCLLAGDYNYDIIKYNTNEQANNFLNHLCSHSFNPLMLRPTRLTSTSHTLIDNIFINYRSPHMRSGILIDDFSDHLPIFYIAKNHSEDHRLMHDDNCDSALSPDLSSHNLIALDNSLLNHRWEDELVEGNINDKFNTFMNILLNHFETHCPPKRANRKKCNIIKPWMTENLVNCCRVKNRLFSAMVVDRNKLNEIRYKSYKNTLTGVLRRAKMQYYEDQLKLHKKNVKKTWDTIKEAIGKPSKPAPPTRLVVDDVEIVGSKIADVFGDHFSSVAEKLARNIKTNSHFRSFLPPSTANSMVLSAVTVEETNRCIQQICPKKSKDMDGLSMFIIKALSSISIPLTFLFNESMSVGVFPDCLKYAKVIPVFKSGDTATVTNYRPISLLSQFSKIFEKLFLLRLNSFLDRNNVINPNQYGFRAKSRTAYAVTHLVELVTDSLEKRHHAGSVYIDLSKAFDTVDHSILLAKLSHYGIRGVPLNWLESYLTGRQQTVFLSHDMNDGKDNSNVAPTGLRSDDDIRHARANRSTSGSWSTHKPIKYGVPQGSVLGPQLFLMYINDICYSSTQLNFILFADDTTIFCSDPDIKALEHKFNTELDKLSKWFAANKLSLNASKTKLMSFGHKQTILNININGTIIKQVPSTKFLGVTIDSKLSWNEHVKEICNKISRSVGLIGRLKNTLSCDALMMLYHALIGSHLNFGVEVWGGTSQTNLKKLYILQKRALRYITNSKSREHSAPLFKQVKCLDIYQLYQLSLATLVYSAREKLAPVFINNLFTNTNQVHSYPTRFSHNCLYLTDRHTHMKEVTVSVAGTKLWNSLNPMLFQCNNINFFRNKFKRQLLSSA